MFQKWTYLEYLLLLGVEIRHQPDALRVLAVDLVAQLQKLALVGGLQFSAKAVL